CFFSSLPVFSLCKIGKIESFVNWLNLRQTPSRFPPFISSLLLLSQGAEASIVGELCFSSLT
ncbi:hypothetical protein Dimus_017868, partial [Dionaea muscipula]